MSNGGGKSRLTSFDRAMQRDIIRGETNPDALFEQWRQEGAVMTEEEWTEFARAIDAGRPHRPLFSAATCIEFTPWRARPRVFPTLATDPAATFSAARPVLYPNLWTWLYIAFR